MRYRYDTKNLSSQQQAIIRQRDKENILYTTNNNVRKQRVVHPLKIFMKLGLDSTTQFNGGQTLDIYKQFADEKGAVWFSTDSLATGMAEVKRVEFINAIKKGNVVEMYFAVSKTNDGANKMIAVGEVQDIKTDKDGIGSPDNQLTPQYWIKDKNKIWIKLFNITYLDTLDCKDFKIATTGANLMDVISKSQYHFGYIVRE